MKIRNYILLVIVTLSIFSCTKDDDFFGTPYYYRDTVYIHSDTVNEGEVNNNDVGNIDDDIINSGDIIDGEVDYLSNIINKEWVLTKARVYVENMDLNTKKYYDYFTYSRTTASMSLFDPTEVPIFDEITLHETTWNFNDGEYFTVDGEYDYNMQTHYNPFDQLIFRPYGFYGGTSRPIVVQYSNNEMMKVITRESYGSDNTHNYKYFSELVFKKEGTGYGYDGEIIEGYTFNGLWEYNYNITSNNGEINLSGSEWLLTRYNVGVEAYYPYDTLHFTSNSTYRLNNDLTERRYSLYNVTNSNMSSITFYGLTTLGGDYSGQVLTQGLADGEINNSDFTDIWDGENQYSVWIKRIN
jgi:hypothetical protein